MQQQQMPPNHQQAMARTLPRQQQNGYFNSPCISHILNCFFFNLTKLLNFFRPPVISGSHTLAHPSKNHYHSNIRSIGGPGMGQGMGPGMGTNTLGRLPSHNHSPNHHMMGKIFVKFLCFKI